MVYKDHSIYSMYTYIRRSKKNTTNYHIRPQHRQCGRDEGEGGRTQTRCQCEKERESERIFDISPDAKTFNTIKLVMKMITLAKPKHSWTFSVKVQFPTHVVHLNTVPLFLLFFFFFCNYKDSQRYHDQQTTLKSNIDKTLAILYHN